MLKFLQVVKFFLCIVLDENSFILCHPIYSIKSIGLGTKANSIDVYDVHR